MFFRGLLDKMLKNKRFIKYLLLVLSDKMVGEFVFRFVIEVNKLLWYIFNILVDLYDGIVYIFILKVNSIVEIYRCI